MKFRAVISSAAGGAPVQDTIHKVLLALHRLQKVTKGTTPGSIQSIVLQLTPDGFAFCHKGGVDEGSQTWSHFQAAKLFQDYRIESKRSNKISLEAQIPNLLHVFSSCANSDITTLRLANGQDGRPVLHFDFSLAGNATDHKVGQEVPVRVIPEAEAEGIREPEMPEPEFQIELPGSVAKLRNVLDRMKQVGATLVAVEASKEAGGADLPGGKAWLKLTAESEVVQITTTFPSLNLVTEGKNEPAPERSVALQLSLKRLAEVMSAVNQLSADTHIACIIEGKALVLYALLPSGLGSLISYTPVVEA
mmetsp:Transcript_34032/g.73610  ORF Transcript_34032/g.73610 Transcript_34032/m.73610 type:complete len:306 (-) Transcript_34032:11-928(-)